MPADARPVALVISQAGPGTSLGAPATSPAAHLGAIVMHINWPVRSGYQAQTIPVAATDGQFGVINVIAVPQGQAQWQTGDASASVSYPTTSATLSALPAGNYTVTAQAFQLPGAQLIDNTQAQSETLVARASTTVTLVGNTAVPLSITMNDADPPVISSITTDLNQTLFWSPGSPWASAPLGSLPSNLTLVIHGTGLLGFDASSPSITIATGSPPATGSLNLNSWTYGGGGSNPDTLDVAAPSSWGGTGLVSVQVDGLTATDDILLTIVSTASITPATASVASRTGTITLTVSASLPDGTPLDPKYIVLSGNHVTIGSWSGDEAELGGGIMDPSSLATNLGMYPGTMSATYDAVVDPSTPSTYVATISYTASTSVGIPDTAPLPSSCGSNGCTGANTAFVDIPITIGGVTAASADVTIP